MRIKGLIMGENYEMLTNIEKKIILSLVAIEKVTTLKLHKVFKELGCVEKVLDLTTHPNSLNTLCNFKVVTFK